MLNQRGSRCLAWTALTAMVVLAGLTRPIGVSGESSNDREASLTGRRQVASHTGEIDQSVPPDSSASELPSVAGKSKSPDAGGVGLLVAGIAQDAGFPQAGCQKKCCAAAWKDVRLRRMVSCLVLIDKTTGQSWFFDCTPDFPDQLQLTISTLNQNTQPAVGEQDSKPKKGTLVDGIFLSHAHMGHYTGLMHLGREAMGASSTQVYAMPRMKRFLETNGPWSQLVNLKNVNLRAMENETTIAVREDLRVTPFLVPHRDEFSETVGFVIKGPNKSALFIPDIDKWAKWDESIEKMIEKVDVAFLDGTFLENGEIPGRDMSLIPHPFVMESIKRFSALDLGQRSKVKFIHLNHTNPALDSNSQGANMIRKAGMSVAQQGAFISL